jgi:hypothetical protein
MQKLNASSGAGPDAKPESGWDASESKLVERGDGSGDSCGVAHDFGSCSAATASSGIRAGSCGGSATSTTTGEDYCSGRDCSYGDGDRTAEREP